jgi:uncharacterized protein with PIN domain
MITWYGPGEWFRASKGQGDMNLKKMMTICAACKKELRGTSSAVIEQALAFPGLTEEVVTSHGICYECGVQWYGTEIMAKIGAESNTVKMPEDRLQHPDRFCIL